MLITEIKYQIATTVKWKYSCAVLGLAACHVSQNCNEKLQVRPAGQAGYPISLVASLDTVPVKCCVPLHYLRREKGEEKGRKFYIYPDVTHTHANNHTPQYLRASSICICICVHIYIYTYTNTYTNTYIYIHTHIYICQGATCAPKIYSLVHRFWFRFWLSRTHKSLNYT